MRDKGCIRLTALDGSRHLATEITVSGGEIKARTESGGGMKTVASEAGSHIRPSVTYRDGMTCITIPKDGKLEAYTMLYCPYTIRICSFSFDFSRDFEA